MEGIKDRVRPDGFGIRRQPAAHIMLFCNVAMKTEHIGNLSMALSLALQCDDVYTTFHIDHGKLPPLRRKSAAWEGGTLFIALSGYTFSSPAKTFSPDGKGNIDTILHPSNVSY